MKKILLVVIAVPIILLASIAAFVWVTHVDHQTPPAYMPVPRPASDNYMRAVVEERGKTMLTEDQRSEYNTLFRDVAQAFHDERHDMLEAWRKTLPGRVESIPNAASCDDLFNQFTRPFHHAIFKEFVWRESGMLRDFQTKGELERYLKTSFAAVRLLCDMYGRRKSYYGPFGILEANVLTKLKCYREKFDRSGRKDLSELVEKAMCQWTEQIESTNGYTRISTSAYVDVMARQWGRKRERELNGDTRTWADVLKLSIEVGAKNLIGAGYIPQWIDDFKSLPDPDEYEHEIRHNNPGD